MIIYTHIIDNTFWIDSVPPPHFYAPSTFTPPTSKEAQFIACYIRTQSLQLWGRKNDEWERGT